MLGCKVKKFLQFNFTSFLPRNFVKFICYLISRIFGKNFTGKDFVIGPKIPNAKLQEHSKCHEWIAVVNMDHLGANPGMLVMHVHLLDQTNVNCCVNL